MLGGSRPGRALARGLSSHAAPPPAPPPPRAKVSLNEIAAQSTMRLIQGALDAGVKLAEVYIDTVGGCRRAAGGGLPLVRPSPSVRARLRCHCWPLAAVAASPAAAAAARPPQRSIVRPPLPRRPRALQGAALPHLPVPRVHRVPQGRRAVPCRVGGVHRRQGHARPRAARRPGGGGGGPEGGGLCHRTEPLAAPNHGCTAPLLLRLLAPACPDPSCTLTPAAHPPPRRACRRTRSLRAGRWAQATPTMRRPRAGSRVAWTPCLGSTPSCASAGRRRRGEADGGGFGAGRRRPLNPPARGGAPGKGASASARAHMAPLKPRPGPHRPIPHPPQHTGGALRRHGVGGRRAA
jgi:hypothetical protein